MRPAGLLHCALLLHLGASAGLPAHPRLILTLDAQQAIFALGSSPDPFAATNAAHAISQAVWVNSTVRANGVARGDGTADVSADAAALGDAGGRPYVQAFYSLSVGAALLGNTTTGPATARDFRAAAVVLTNRVAAASEWDTNGTVQLNTGETLHAIGLAFDYLYEDLTADERTAVVSAVVNLGLSRVRAALSSSPPAWAVAFVSTRSNWNLVILSGTVIATLAIEGEPGAPEWVPELRARALSNLLAWSLAAWGPDGAWPEGPNYSGYAARYTVPLVASLLTATGSDSGIRALPGVLQAPRFILATLAPTRPFPSLWDYFDSRVTPETLASYLALCSWAGDAPACAGVKKALLSVAPYIPSNDAETTAMNAPLALIYYTPIGVPGQEAELPLVSRFRGVEVVAARSSFTDVNATYIAFKGLNTTGNWAHTHLDQGSFVFATQGQWFAQDLGSDSYSAPSYFWNNRFDLYRTNISGHNSLSFSGRNPYCKIIATYAANCTASLLTVFNESAAPRRAAAAPFAVDAFAVVDLTEGLLPLGLGLERVQRGFIVGAGRTQLVTVDEVAFEAARANSFALPPPLWWKLHTVANVSLSSDRATATLSTFNVSAAVTVRFLGAASQCPGASFSVAPLDLLPPLLESPGVRVLQLTADAAACARLVVAVGVDPPGVGAAGVRPLSQWRESGPFAD